MYPIGKNEGNKYDGTSVERIIKIFLDNGNRKLSTEEKERIKLAIDQANSLNDLLQVAFASLTIDAHR